MEPIINPKLIYWLNTSESIKSGAIIVFACTLIAFLTCLGVYIYNKFEGCDYEVNKQYAAMCKPLLTWLTIVVLITAIAGVFIPAKETIIEMIIAEQVTKDNITIGIDGIKSVVDYIIEKVQTFK